MHGQISSESISPCIACGNDDQFEILCRSPDFRYDGGEKFAVVRCQECALVATHPCLPWSELEDHYPDEYYEDRALDECQDGRPGRATHPLAEITEIDDLLEGLEVGRMLEIGCGTGETLAYWEEKGWTCTGVEPSPTATQVAADEYGLNVYQGRFDEVDLEGEEFDVVLLDNVLEHLHRPLEAIERIYDLLSSSGWLVVEVPNIDSLGFALFGRYWSDLDVPRHLYHFSPATLTREAAARGFERETISFSGYTIIYRFSLNRYLTATRSLSVGRWVGIPLLPVTILSRTVGSGDRFRARFKKE